jgi:hypothetical protein
MQDCSLIHTEISGYMRMVRRIHTHRYRMADKTPHVYDGHMTAACNVPDTHHPPSSVVIIISNQQHRDDLAAWSWYSDCPK